MGFTTYSSGDSGAPVLTGLTGSLLALLDAVLVNGYGAKPAAGWTKPLPNTSSYGMYRQGGGATCSLFLYDAGSGSASGAEALATGWDTISDMNSGAITGSNPFPTFTQQNIGGGNGGGAGAMVIRKSTAPTNISRGWVIFADSSSMYLFIRPADTTFGIGYTGFMFGDFFSLKSGSVDTARCMISGRNAVSSSAVANDRLDVTIQTSLTTGVTGHYAAHSFSGLSSSMPLGKHGDGAKSNSGTSLHGSVPFLNGTDNGVYLSPIWLVEATTGTIRGRMRGFYQFCHTTTSLVDSQQFSGSSDFPGRTFQVVIPSANQSMFFLETSNTLETNSP